MSSLTHYNIGKLEELHSRFVSIREQYKEFAEGFRAKSKVYWDTQEKGWFLYKTRRDRSESVIMWFNSELHAFGWRDHPVLFGDTKNFRRVYSILFGDISMLKDHATSAMGVSLDYYDNQKLIELEKLLEGDLDNVFVQAIKDLVSFNPFTGRFE